jgi:hypothetical protein
MLRNENKESKGYRNVDGLETTCSGTDHHIYKKKIPGISSDPSR